MLQTGSGNDHAPGLVSVQAKRMAILTRSSAPDEVCVLAGGKGRNISILSRHGIAVPAWSIIPASICSQFIATSGLAAVIERILSDVDLSSAEGAARAIQQEMMACQVDEGTLRVVQSAYDNVGSSRVAVRSSGPDEDGDKVSFAGQYDSFLNISELGCVLDAVKRCWASAYSSRCLTYRLSRKIVLGVQDIGVIIQEMVDANKSGVVFTANPMSGARDELVISATYGLGDGLVSGQVDGDTIIVDRRTSQIKTVSIADKSVRHISSAACAGVSTMEVPEPDQKQLSLTDVEIESIRRAAERIEAIFATPQDIEWSISDGVLCILQARSITTLPQAPVRLGEMSIWENSNIIENFNGITSPMTFSFARQVYYEVYREYARILGVPRDQLNKMDPWLRNMLGYHNGRVYYNLLNWYKIVRLVPFYRVNRRMLELAIGVEEPIDDETAHRLRPLATESRAREFLVRSINALAFAYHFTTIAGSVNRFVKRFYTLQGQYDSIEYGSRPAAETLTTLRQLMPTFLAMWGRMILLEQTIGWSVGALSGLTKVWLPNAPGPFLYEMMKPDERIESLQPVDRMIEIAESIKHDEVLTNLIHSTPAESVQSALTASGDPSVRSFLGQVERYVQEFGYRSINELKLEEPDLRENPSIFFAMLKSVLLRVQSTERANVSQQDPDCYLNGELSWWRRVVYKAVRRKVRRCLAARERVRFCRTRAFGTARRMLRAIGSDLTRVKLLQDPSDIYYLRLSELNDWFDGALSHREVLVVIEQRKALRKEYAQLEAPGRFRTWGAIGGEDYERQYGWSKSGAAVAGLDASQSGRLSGTPCCSGVAQAEAQVVTEPREVSGKILVTYRTDPGWCPVLPSAAALLIERGSPLTHVAIVARELGIPTIIQIKDLTKRVTTGMILRVDGETGVVTIVSKEQAETL